MGDVECAVSVVVAEDLTGQEFQDVGVADEAVVEEGGCYFEF